MRLTNDRPQVTTAGIFLSCLIGAIAISDGNLCQYQAITRKSRMEYRSKSVYSSLEDSLEESRTRAGIWHCYSNSFPCSVADIASQRILAHNDLAQSTFLENVGDTAFIFNRLFRSDLYHWPPGYQITINCDTQLIYVEKITLTAIAYGLSPFISNKHD